MFIFWVLSSCSLFVHALEDPRAANARLHQTNLALKQVLTQITAEAAVGAEDPCKGIADGFKPAGNRYWGPTFKRAGLTTTQTEGICRGSGMWYYNSVSTCVGAGGHSAVCDSSKVVCPGGGKKYGWGSQQAAATKAALNNGGTHPNCPNACENVPGGESMGGNSYWGPKLRGAGLTAVEAGRVCFMGGQWYYNGRSTCVGGGGSSAACDSSRLVCAGGSRFGYGTQQAAAVNAAVRNGGAHANCPPPPPPSPGSCSDFLCAMPELVKEDAVCPGGQSSCDMATCCEQINYNTGKGNCKSDLYGGWVEIEDRDLVKRTDRNCYRECENSPACYGFVLPNAHDENWCQMVTIGGLRGGNQGYNGVSASWQCFSKRDYKNYEPLLEGDSRCKPWGSRTSVRGLDNSVEHDENSVSDLKRARCARKCLNYSGSKPCVAFSIKHRRGSGGFTNCYLQTATVCKNQQGPMSFWSYAVKR